MISWLKAKAIQAADVLNAAHDPFPALDRPGIPLGTAKKLSELEAEFYDDLVTGFWGCDGQVLLHRIPLPPGSPLDTGDQAIWHGIYTGMLALRYHQAADGGTQARVYADLVEAVKGLQLHQTIHNELAPRLIRGVSDDLKTWQDDASNDSATGHLMGIYFGWKFGPQTMQPVFVKLATGLAASLLGNGCALVRADGTPTTYGALDQGWKSDPLRISLAMAIYAAAATITKQPAFMKAYSDLFVKYKSMVAYPKVKFLWAENYGDTHRAAIHLSILADCTNGDPCALYSKGLRRILDMTAKDGNIWVNALCTWGTQMTAPHERPMALKILSEFDLKRKGTNEGRDASKYIDGRPEMSWLKKILWNGVFMANQPVPRWMARSQDFFWQRNLRSLDIGSDGAEADSKLNGGDFLAAYWLSRLTGILNADD